MRQIQYAFALVVAFLVLAPHPAVADKERDREEEKLWVSLGTRTVDFKNTKDVFEVGKRDGRFTHLRFKVESGEVIVEEVEVTYGDGKTWKHKVDHEFKESNRSHDIEIAEGAHVIRKVEIVYKKLRRSEPVTIELLGKMER
jgi:hypothetical protein